jgi:sulfate adenylyltransferase
VVSLLGVNTGVSAQLAAVVQPLADPLDAGVCIWFTGLSGSGKTTTAEILRSMVVHRGRRVTMLDGDVVRTHLSRGLGYSREDRDANVRRIGFVASEIVRHGGVVICATVSPYQAARDEVRAMVGPDRFVEVFVDTPLEECERRDTKGLYAKARRGEIQHFTGIDDPYEPPEAADVILADPGRSPSENASLVMDELRNRSLITSITDLSNRSSGGRLAAST